VGPHVTTSTQLPCNTEGSFRRRYLLTVQPSGTFVREAALLADWYAKFAASFEQATV
jgi:hypothetical protein